MINMNDLAYKMRNVAHAQKMNGANIGTDTFMMLRHCAKKVTEAQTAFDQFKFTEEILDLNDSHIKECEKLYKDFISELADIIACVLIVCANEPTIDIEKAMRDCLEKNLAKVNTFEKRTPKQITITDRSNQAKMVNALQNAFDMKKIEYEEANSLANWLDNLVNNQMER